MTSVGRPVPARAGGREAAKHEEGPRGQREGHGARAGRATQPSDAPFSSTDGDRHPTPLHTPPQARLLSAFLHVARPPRGNELCMWHGRDTPGGVPTEPGDKIPRGSGSAAG
ncbi:hypothetical protein PHLGIDRAFT_120317 [Phlebiopsis gigantea 11061_1 CR5-6]|uniref:Uncharacterized protein n=1 Tax=Phlebiopsis gigantea (strain 11061_1 CR5-6) TaxID=745531 RepID=A0A0C3S7U9_PHLG1|nr:hypothetical protein PHLGIDRAFT_120317 [Phlebiopsis gigantea 11061_1 CR5-6]